MRRSLQKLIENVAKAKSQNVKALAYYRLGLFHDNNGREAEAIPNYLKAIKLGLANELEAKARAWLASSLYKIGRPKSASKQQKLSLTLTHNPKLHQFLLGLEKRVRNG
ncbi:MAG: tetratricopeptide repeat protein [Candidatus Vogelbacteria bacterium]|nr:tetratricopeptide repeat protein [Candidatus Vogelbacteria bacterium]